MIGPVFQLELTLGGRRGRQRVFRWVYAGWLVLQLGALFLAYRADYAARNAFATAMKNNAAAAPGTVVPVGPAPVPLTAEFGENFVQLFLAQQFALLLVLTPAFAAGAITDEKTRGTLQYLLCADLTPGEIVLGKLLGRMLQVGLLLLTGLPVLCFAAPFGGASPALIGGAVLTCLGPLFAVAAASVLASVWVRHTRDAVLSLYAVGLGAYALWDNRGVIAAPPAALELAVLSLNPNHVIEPLFSTADGGEFARRLAASLALWGVLGLACVGLAAARLAPAYRKQLEGSGRRVLPKALGRLVRRPAVWDDPVRWKARFVDGLAPLPLLRLVPRWGVVLAVAAGTSWLCGEMVTSGRLLVANDFQALAAAALFVLAGVVGVKTSGAVSGERERQTWEALLLTPLTTEELVRGKLWGVLFSLVPVFLAYAVPATLAAFFAGGEPFVSVLLGLLAAVVGCVFMGATGLWCSVTSRGSWRALLGTMGFGYVGGFILVMLTTPVIGVVAVILYLLLLLIDALFQTNANAAFGGFGGFYAVMAVASVAGVAVTFTALTWWFLGEAVRQVSKRERTIEWTVITLAVAPRRRRVRRLRNPVL